MRQLDVYPVRLALLAALVMGCETALESGGNGAEADVLAGDAASDLSTDDAGDVGSASDVAGAADLAGGDSADVALEDTADAESLNDADVDGASDAVDAAGGEDEVDAIDSGDIIVGDIIVGDIIVGDTIVGDTIVGDTAENDAGDVSLVDVDLTDTSSSDDVNPDAGGVDAEFTDASLTDVVLTDGDLTDAVSGDGDADGADAVDAGPDVDDALGDALEDLADDVEPDAAASDLAGDGQDDAEEVGQDDAMTTEDAAGDVGADVVVNLAPVGVPVLSLTPTKPLVGQKLSVTVTTPSVDPENQPLTWTFAWSLDGVPTTFTTTSVPGDWVKKGQVWTVTAVASDGELNGPTGSATVTVVNAPPTAVVLAADPTSVGLTGTAKVAIAVPSADADGDQIQTSVVWKWKGSVIAGGFTLDVPNTLPGGEHLGVGPLEVVVTAMDSEGAKTVTTKTIQIVASPVCGSPWDPCAAHTDCTENGTLVPACACSLGWEGPNTACTDVDECADPLLNQCSIHAQCVDMDGSYDCTCLKGWTGNGLDCQDINECADVTPVCGANATCKNEDGSHTCTCNPNWVWDGNACVNDNECLKVPAVCGANAICEDKTDGYTCKCEPGYVDVNGVCVTACEAYCTDVTAHCVGNNAQYLDKLTCTAICTGYSAWPLGTAGDMSGDSVSCRASYATAASVVPGSFCAAAGPSGGGVCGSLCEGFCDFAIHGCDTEWPNYGTCKSTCAGWGTDGVDGATSGNTVQCRMTYALTSMATLGQCPYTASNSSKCVTSIDLSGWKIEQQFSTQAYTFPANTLVPEGGYLVLSRAATKAEFEAFYGVTLAANVVYIQSASNPASSVALPAINGDEVWTLKKGDGSVVDGPTYPLGPSNPHVIYVRALPATAASNAGAWVSVSDTLVSNATPGGGQTAGYIKGVYLSEMADVHTGTDLFKYEFVELFVDPGP